MNRFKLLVLLMVLFFHFSFAQTITYDKLYFAYPGEDAVHAGSAIPTADGGVIVGNIHNLMKLDSIGDVQYRKDLTFSMAQQMPIWSFALKSNGELVGFGTYSVFSFDTSYNIISLDSLGSINTFTPFASMQTSDGGYLLAGVQDSRGCLAKLDSNKTALWAKSYSLSNSFITNFDNLVATPDGGCIAIGTMKSIINPGNVADCVVLRVDSLGEVVWGRSITTLNGTTLGRGVVETHDGNYMIGANLGTLAGLIKIDPNGIVIYMKSYHTPSLFGPRTLGFTSDKGFVLTGSAVVTYNGVQDMTGVLLKIDSLGNIDWARYFGVVQEMLPFHAFQAADGGYVISCTRPYALNGNLHSLSVIKTDSLGYVPGCLIVNAPFTSASLQPVVTNILVTDSAFVLNTYPKSMTFPNIGTVIDYCAWLGENEGEPFSSAKISLHPNPTSGTFTVSFNFNSYETPVFEIYDVFGRLVSSREPIRHAGSIIIRFSESTVNGVYFFKIKNYKTTLTRKIVLRR